MSEEEYQYERPSTKIIPKGTYLFRAAPNICDVSKSFFGKERFDPDTGKLGLYFADFALLAVSMAVEYKQNLQLGVFVVVDDFPVLIGKYSSTNPQTEERFRKGEKEFSRSRSDNPSHFDSGMAALVSYYQWLSNTQFDFNIGEVFVSSSDLRNVKFVAAFQIKNWKGFEKWVISNVPNDKLAVQPRLNLATANSAVLRSEYLERIVCSEEKAPFVCCIQ